MRGKAGPKPLTQEEAASGKYAATNNEDTENKPKPMAIRCAGCDSTEVQFRDDQNFFYCGEHLASASSNAVARHLTDEELKEVRTTNAAAGVPLTPTKTERQKIEEREAENRKLEREREANGNKPITIPKFPRRVSKVLPIELTEMELAAFRTRESEHVALMLAAEKEKKEIVAPIAERIKESKKEITNISMIITSGVKHDNVDCEWRIGPDNNSKELWRLDRNQRVDVQPLDFDDRQMELREAQEANMEIAFDGEDNDDESDNDEQENVEESEAQVIN